MSTHYLIRLSMLLLQRRRWFIAVFQCVLALGALVLAWLLRFDFSLPHLHDLLVAAAVLPLIRLGMFAKFHLLHGWWQYTAVHDARNITKAAFCGTLLFWLAMSFLPLHSGFPRSVYVLEMILSATSLAGVRIVSRLVAQSVRTEELSDKKALLIGAGFAAQAIIRELARQGSGYRIVGCVDDDRTKAGIAIDHVPVLGSVEQLPEILARQPVDQVLIAVPSATGEQMRRFVEICNRAKVAFRTVPTLREIIAGEVKVSQLREVRLEDLLGRNPAKIDLETVRKEIAGRTILVTGAAGSIGSELCRQILDFSPSRLICLDQSETGLFFLRLNLDHPGRKTQLSFQVADVCDPGRLRRIFQEFKPETVFHAAAYKHVPLMEHNVQEAVKNNVLGLAGLLDLADEAACGSFVLISSDKAVNPTSVMGATKRLGELILSSRTCNGLRCVSVRFGNVLGSSGSVIPVLQQQLENREPLTITHPDIKRFFMTIREAVALVLQAFAIGKHGDILVLDMGEPLRIVDLARTLIRLSGKSEQEVEIRFTGLREGEKLKEELFYEQEAVIPTCCEKIKRIKAPVKDWLGLCRQLRELRESMSLDGAGPIRRKIKEIVPEYSLPSAESAGGEREPAAEALFRIAVADD